MKNKKIIIPDSNVFINDPLAMYNFEDNEVVILDVVRTEVSNLKTKPGSAGKHARRFINEIYKLTNEYGSQIASTDGIKINQENENHFGILRIYVSTNNNEKLSITYSENNHRDQKILKDAIKIQKENPSKDVIIVSDDKSFGTDIVLEGMRHQSYKHDKVISSIKDIYKGYIYLPIEADDFDKLEKLITTGDKKVYLSDKNALNCEIEKHIMEDNSFLADEVGAYKNNLTSRINLYHIYLPDLTEKILYPNEFIIFQKSYAGEPTDKELITFINFENPDNPFLEALRIDDSISNIKSKSVKSVRNIQQDMMIHLSKTPYVEIISGLGPAGSGKTLLAVASACEDAGLSTGYKQVTNNRENVKYKEILVSRTFVTIEKDLGALPGDESEKTEPLFRPIKDNLKVIMKENEALSNNMEDNINFLTFTYLQGRSIDDAVIILDEAQNTHIVDMESFLTRSGENSRIFLTGDPMQVRKQSVGPLNNGLTTAVELFKGCPFFGTVYMQQAVRSKKAEYSTILLNQMM